MRRPTAAIMIQGTGSDVGKSVIVAGLCRALTRRGLAVRPFKPQNMSNNAAATADGEIGRAQALQARAAAVPATTDMNPVLLKPESESGAQIVVQGRRLASASASDYVRLKPTLMPAVLDSFARLAKEADIVLVEGAGSPAEINLRAGDIANMGFAEAADVPVVLVGDIDRGGVIAALVGTHALLPAPERGRVRGFLINRFRGDPRLFDDGLSEIARRTGWPALGVVPWFDAAARLPAEDILGLVGQTGDAATHIPARVPSQGSVKDSAGLRIGERLHVVVPRLPRIANFDDLDPLRHEPGVRVEIVPLDRPLPADADLVLIPGSKATRADLAALRAAGWDIDLKAHRRRGGLVLGVCGGYQMLGRTVADPDGLEGEPGTSPGLGLLDLETVLCGPKVTARTSGTHVASGLSVVGYRIHLGRTHGPDCARPFLTLDTTSEGGAVIVPDGAVSADGRVAGTYLHGLFDDDRFRAAYLAGFGLSSGIAYGQMIEATLDALADHLEAHVDIGRLLAIASAGGRCAGTRT